jgi:general secretion pathway protein B
LAILAPPADPVIVDMPEKVQIASAPLPTPELVEKQPSNAPTLDNSDTKEELAASIDTPIDTPIVELIEDTQTAQDEQPNPSISPDLLRRFESALASLDQEPEAEYETEVTTISDVPRVHELPARTLTILPSMAFSAHMYASDPKERWVRVNGRRVNEGDYIEDDLRVVNIKPQELILSFNGQEFSMAALTDW